MLTHPITQLLRHEPSQPRDYAWHQLRHLRIDGTPTRHVSGEAEQRHDAAPVDAVQENIADHSFERFVRRLTVDVQLSKKPLQRLRVARFHPLRHRS